MSETPFLDIAATPNVPAVVEPKKRTFLAAALSAAIPGIGHFLLSQKVKACSMLAAFVIFILAVRPFGIVSTYKGYIASVFVLLFLTIYCACDALFSPRNPGEKRTSTAWLLLFVPLAFCFGAIDYNVVLRVDGFRVFSIPSSSMETTLIPGDRIVADMRCYSHRSPARGDIVIFYRNKDAAFLIKRVIAIGGDSIESKDGQIILNKKELDEPYAVHSEGGSSIPELNTFGPILVPPGKYFVMGDNRDVSYDSRSHDFSFLDETEIRGRPLYIFKSSADRSGRMLR